MSYYEPESTVNSKLQPLRTAYEAFRDSFINGAMLEEVGKQIPGYLSLTRPQMGDGRTWFWGLSFKADQGIVSVLFPRTKFMAGQNFPERPVEVRKFGNVSGSRIETIIEKLTELLTEQKRINDSHYTPMTFFPT